MIVSVFFDGWESVVRILLIGSLAYLMLVFTLGLSGRRLIAKMNAFDFVGNVALGSTLAGVVLNKNVALADGLAAFAVLLVLPLLINFFSSHSRLLNKMVGVSPIMLFYQGQMLEPVLKHTRISSDEVLTAMRLHGIAAADDVYAVILEANGSFSVIRQGAEGSRTALQDITTPGLNQQTKRED